VKPNEGQSTSIKVDQPLDLAFHSTENVEKPKIFLKRAGPEGNMLKHAEL
jgi:hypothetical protein